MPETATSPSPSLATTIADRIAQSLATLPDDEASLRRDAIRNGGLRLAEDIKSGEIVGSVGAQILFVTRLEAAER